MALKHYFNGGERNGLELRTASIGARMQSISAVKRIMNECLPIPIYNMFKVARELTASNAILILPTPTHAAFALIDSSSFPISCHEYLPSITEDVPTIAPRLLTLRRERRRAREASHCWWSTIELEVCRHWWHTIWWERETTRRREWKTIRRHRWHTILTREGWHWGHAASTWC